MSEGKFFKKSSSIMPYWQYNVVIKYSEYELVLPADYYDDEVLL